MIRFLLLALAVGVLVFALGARGGFAARPGPLPTRARADLVVVEKDAHTLTLYARGRVLRSYFVALGSGGVEAKTRAGDGRTPEGHYLIDAHRADSAFYRALRLSYPSAMDRKVAAARGVPPGGGIVIRGLPNHTGWIGGWHRLIDWTDGSIAVTDGEMDEIWRAVPNGTPVEIRR
ncbi:MAG TPA: L,D-transpeptidase family protein [Rhizomicrobium sp.]